MTIFIGLIPAFAWGVQPLIVTKVGGKPVNQLLGTVLGAFLISILLLLVLLGVSPPYYNLFYSPVFWCAFASGVAWTIGQLFQYTAFKAIGVAKGMPISAGLQIVSNNIFGVVAYGDWRSSSYPYQMILVGCVAVILIIVGISCVSYKQTLFHKNVLKLENTKQQKKIPWKIIFIFAISTCGFLCYYILSQLPLHIDNSTNIYQKMFGPNSSINSLSLNKTWYGFSQFFPQCTAMLLITIIFILFLWLKPYFFNKNKLINKKQLWHDCPFNQHYSYINIFAGLAWAFGGIAILLSEVFNGIATATVLGQMNIVIAALGGVFLLKEHKAKKELLLIVIGIGLMVAGGIIVALLPKIFPPI